jgi:hypothetical protein
MVVTMPLFFDKLNLPLKDGRRVTVESHNEASLHLQIKQRKRFFAEGVFFPRLPGNG